LADAVVTPESRVDGRFVEVDVNNVCMIELGVMRCVHGDDVNKLLEPPANEEKEAYFVCRHCVRGRL